MHPMSILRSVFSTLFSRTFRIGVLTGLILGAGGLFLFARVYMQFAGTPDRGPEFSVPDVSVEDIHTVRDTIPNDWSLYSVEDGGEMQFGALTDDPVLLNVWATWCDPCTAQRPALQTVRDSMASVVTVIFVSPEPRSTVRDHIDSNESVDGAYVADHFPSGLQGDVVPRTYVVRAGGEVVSLYVGPRDWDDEVMYQMIDRLQTTVAEADVVPPSPY